MFFFGILRICPRGRAGGAAGAVTEQWCSLDEDHSWGIACSGKRRQQVGPGQAESTLGRQDPENSQKVLIFCFRPLFYAIKP